MGYSLVPGARQGEGQMGEVQRDRRERSRGSDGRGGVGDPHTPLKTGVGDRWATTCRPPIYSLNATLKGGPGGRAIRMPKVIMLRGVSLGMRIGSRVGRSVS